MPSNFLVSLITTLVVAVSPALSQASGSGRTTRYWDCCKPSCSWPDKAPVSSPVGTCDANNNPISDANAASGCDGGGAFTCANYSPWAVDDNTAYGFAATHISGSNEAAWCCACYRLSFTSGPVAGKTMIVQATNTGGDLGENHFDILIPGGGYGGIPGAQYGGVSSREECSQMPAPLVAGCQWRFDWFQGADNPDMTFEEVQCPGAITAISGCVRQG
ncbi:endoglucanase-5 [Stachybotrys elegans]|uniref:Cellulase n=1 Tax=Stachybotrys elegans TaxID=80388 RepID=A0A8K0SS66_9HYPO|nr:endoglucanase-5 [Stachybotrys elegans]